ncbi:hypothetical protein BDP67DRAFT_489572 [Colletotrichum lupini]|nr:hypothetical protein BDP67DRAFT_489572 [Colletotrichum lupini]
MAGKGICVLYVPVQWFWVYGQTWHAVCDESCRQTPLPARAFIADTDVGKLVTGALRFRYLYGIRTLVELSLSSMRRVSEQGRKLTLGWTRRCQGPRYLNSTRAGATGVDRVVPSSVAVDYSYRPNPVSPGVDVLSTSNGPLGRFLFPWTVAVSALC